MHITFKYAIEFRILLRSVTNCQEVEGRMVWILVGAKRTLAITILRGKVEGGGELAGVAMRQLIQVNGQG